jgi:tRNA guanosine-2'-O-methyltransferase
LRPWKELACDVADLREDVRPEKTELIVVASLVERVPNLGGLCRTCEIFGVGKLVLNTANVVEDKEFVSLSVSSHKWVDIAEVS